jgi:hypothetical protein
MWGHRSLSPELPCRRLEWRVNLPSEMSLSEAYQHGLLESSALGGSPPLKQWVYVRQYYIRAYAELHYLYNISFGEATLSLSRNPIRLFVLSSRLCGAGTTPRNRRIDYPNRRIAWYEDLAALGLLVHLADKRMMTFLIFHSKTEPAAALGAWSLVLDV